MISTNCRLRPTGTLYAIAIVWLSFSVPRSLDAQEPSAASAAFTSRDEVVLDALKLVRSGNFASAEELLSQKNLDGDADARRSEPADFQRGEVEVDGQNLYFDEWESKSEVVR